MELNRVPDDLYAGYIVEDSDLEYSDCSEEGRFVKQKVCQLVFYLMRTKQLAQMMKRTVARYAEDTRTPLSNNSYQVMMNLRKKWPQKCCLL